MREQSEADGLPLVGGDSVEEVTETLVMLRPDYASEAMRVAGEQLGELYRQKSAGASDHDAEIAKLRAKMRRGPHLRPGEFLAEGRFQLLRPASPQDTRRFLALDRETGDRVWVEVQAGGWVDSDSELARFKEAASARATSPHSGVARVLHADRSVDGFVYLVLEHCGEFDFAEAVRAGRLDRTDVLQAVLELAHACAASHDQGVIHGHLSPRCIMLSDDGSANLAHFEIRGDVVDRNSLYLAPERMQRGSTPSASGDVYSLSMVLLFGLHGEDLPFWVLRDPSRLIDELSVPPVVADLLSCGLEWDLDRRPTSPAQWIEPLSRDVPLLRELASRAEDRGRLKAAVAHHQALLEHVPEERTELHSRLGQLTTQLGEHAMARVHLLQALEQVSAAEQVDVAPLLPVLAQWWDLAEATGEWAEFATELDRLSGERSGEMAAALSAATARVWEDEAGQPSAALQAWGRVVDHHVAPDEGREALRAQRRLAESEQAWPVYVAATEALLPFVDEAERGELAYAIGRTLLVELNQDAEALEWLEQAEAAGQDLVELAGPLELAWATRGQWDRVVSMMIRRAGQVSGEAETSKILLHAGLIAGAVHEEDLAIRVYEVLLDAVPDHTVGLRNLARIHHRRKDQQRAEALFEQLLTSYKGKNPAEPEASDRAADNTAWARILLRQGRADEAEARLTEALRLNPNLIQALRVAGPLYLDRGEPERAAEMFTRQLQLYRSVDMSRARTRASLGMSDVAWMQGRLTESMLWANRALEVEPDDAHAWWALARSALAARGGHPGADRAPWICAMPARITSLEVLARLFMAVLDPEAMRTWLQRTGMGRGLVESGDTPARSACCVVDVMQRYRLIDPELLDRIEAAAPDATEAVACVRSLLFGGQSELQPVRIYAWSSAAIERDFDPSVARDTVAHVADSVGVQNADLRADAAWAVLLDGAKAPPRAMDALDSGAAQDGSLGEADPNATVSLDVDGRAVLQLAEGATLASGLVAGVGLTLRRCGAWVYLTADRPIGIAEGMAIRARVQEGQVLRVDEVDVTVRVGGQESEGCEPDDSAVEADAAETLEAAEVPPVQAASDAAEPRIEADAEDDSDLPVEDPDGGIAKFLDSFSPLADVLDAKGESEQGEVAEGGEGPDSGTAPEPVEHDPSTDDYELFDLASEPDAPTLEDSDAVLDEPAEEAESVVASELPGGDRRTPTLSPDIQEGEGEPELVSPLDLQGPVLSVPPPVRPKHGATIVPEPDADDWMNSGSHLLVMSGTLRGQRIHIDRGLQVGSGEACGLRLEGDAHVGEVHFELSWEGSDLVLVDAGTEAGTVINGKRDARVVLQGGEVIMVGRTVLRFSR